MSAGADHNRRMRERALAVGALGQPRFDLARHVAVVPSRSRPGAGYEVSLRLVGEHVEASCTCRAGTATGRPLGYLPCWHAARLALSMEATGLLAWVGREGRWVPGPESPPLVPNPGRARAEAELEARRARAKRGRPKYGTPEYAEMVSHLVD